LLFASYEDVGGVECVVTFVFVEGQLSCEVRKDEFVAESAPDGISAAMTGAASRCIGEVSAMSITDWMRRRGSRESAMGPLCGCAEEVCDE
jgi:hypothetical protein